MSREYLTSPIEPLPDDMRGALGIAQGDIIVRTAIIAGLADLRENPKLLNYVFSSLPKDALTYRNYGEEQVKLAKDWFLSQDIPVFMNTRVDESKVPCITIGQASSNEAEASLGDVHYDTTEEDYDEEPIVYGGPYNPLNYVASTGVLTMNSSFDLNVFPGQYVRDNRGGMHLISDVLDAYTLVIDPNLNVPLSGLYVVSAPKKKTVSLESVEFRETYEIGCHAHSEPAYLTYLHSILIFILLRYKEELLEARGLTRTSISSGPVMVNQSFQISQPVYTRMTTLAGFVHQYWPKFFTGVIQGVVPQIATNPTTGIRDLMDTGETLPIYEDDI
jgi:hypothetical protein